MSLAGGSSPLEWGTGKAKIEMSSEFDQKNTRKKNPLRIIWYKDDNTGSEDCSALIFGVKKNTTEKYYYVTLLLLYAAFQQACSWPLPETGCRGRWIIGPGLAQPFLSLPLNKTWLNNSSEFGLRLCMAP